MAIAIGNSDGREELRWLAEQQAALRRVATLVAHGAPPEGLFAVVAEEVPSRHPRHPHEHRQLRARRQRHRTRELSPTTGSSSPSGRAGRSMGPTLSPASARTAVRLASTTTPGWRARSQTPPASQGDPFDRWHSDRRRGALLGGDGGFLGGACAVARRRTPRHASRTSQSWWPPRSRMPRSARSWTPHGRASWRPANGTRRNLERDLHDGAQQLLVSLALELRAAEAMAASGSDDLGPQLSRIGAGLAGVLDDLRELSHGLHPAVLSRGGLKTALKVLARHFGGPRRARRPDRHAAARGHRGNRVLRRLRGIDERARAGPGSRWSSTSPSRYGTRCFSFRFATTGRVAPTRSRLGTAGAERPCGGKRRTR